VCWRKDVAAVHQHGKFFSIKAGCSPGAGSSHVSNHLMNSWFSSMENFDFIRGKGKHFIAALKDNRLVALKRRG